MADFLRTLIIPGKGGDSGGFEDPDAGKLHTMDKQQQQQQQPQAQAQSITNNSDGDEGEMQNPSTSAIPISDSAGPSGTPIKANVAQTHDAPTDAKMEVDARPPHHVHGPANTTTSTLPQLLASLSHPTTAATETPIPSPTNTTDAIEGVESDAPVPATSTMDPTTHSVLSIDEFEKLHGRAFHEAQVSNKAPINPPKKKKFHPFPFPGSAPVNPSAPPTPVQLGTRSSEHTVALYQKCQALGIELPEFDFAGATDVGWGAKLDVAGETIELPGPFASKKEAKEVASGEGVALIERLVGEGRIEGKRGKVGKPDGKTDVVVVEKDEVNYVGMVLEFQNATSAPQPSYTEYLLGTQFACSLYIPNCPRTFGGTSTFYASKKLARQQAAKEAVLWFKEQGLWPETDEKGGIKKKMMKNEAKGNGGDMVAASDTETKDEDMQDTTTTTTASNSTPKSPSSTSTSSSFSAQVAALCPTLGFPVPEYRILPPAPDALQSSGFYSLACYFKGMGKHEGPIGEVRHVFGKKKAKEECAKLVLGYLLRIKEEREGEARRVLGEL